MDTTDVGENVTTNATQQHLVRLKISTCITDEIDSRTEFAFNDFLFLVQGRNLRHHFVEILKCFLFRFVVLTLSHLCFESCLLNEKIVG